MVEKISELSDILMDDMLEKNFSLFATILHSLLYHAINTCLELVDTSSKEIQNMLKGHEDLRKIVSSNKKITDGKSGKEFIYDNGAREKNHQEIFTKDILPTMRKHMLPRALNNIDKQQAIDFARFQQQQTARENLIKKYNNLQ